MANKISQTKSNTKGFAKKSGNVKVPSGIPQNFRKGNAVPNKTGGAPVRGGGKRV